MGALEIVLILIGVTFLMGSFFLPEKLTKKELDKIAELSETEINHIVQNKLGTAKEQIDNDLDDVLEETCDKALRRMEKDSNEKIMAINEYSDSVLDSISKTHNEVMFLYSMLNDKYDELTSYAGELKTLKDDIVAIENNREQMLEELRRPIERTESVVMETYGDDSRTEGQDVDSLNQKARNEKILELHLQGKTAIEIARELGMGVGVVKLVLELYKGDE